MSSSAVSAVPTSLSLLCHSHLPSRRSIELKIANNPASIGDLKIVTGIADGWRKQVRWMEERERGKEGGR